MDNFDLIEARKTPVEQLHRRLNSIRSVSVLDDVFDATILQVNRSLHRNEDQSTEHRECLHNIRPHDGLQSALQSQK
jgi:hypothetical protein